MRSVASQRVASRCHSARAGYRVQGAALSGIAAENLGRIFEAFFTTKPHGMGMGLSVSKTILDRHEGFA